MLSNVYVAVNMLQTWFGIFNTISIYGIHQWSSVVTVYFVLIPQVVSNIGDCYSLNNGTFRAPVQGLYQFTLTIMSQSEVSGKSISTHHQLMKQAKGSEPDIQGTELGHVYAGHAATSTITIATRLEEGDRVYAREQVWSTGHLYGNDYCHFTGLLIRS